MALVTAAISVLSLAAAVVADDEPEQLQPPRSSDTQSSSLQLFLPPTPKPPRTGSPLTLDYKSDAGPATDVTDVAETGLSQPFATTTNTASANFASGFDISAATRFARDEL
ncbi:MAG: hypothetical protein AAF747_08235, partial [Planctomycetota bacterium]